MPEPIVDLWDEPRHHHVLQNELVQVVRLRLKPGDTSLFHRHTVGSIAVALVDYVVEEQRLGEEWVVAAPAPIGRVRSGAPRVHRIRNNGTTDVEVLDVELVGAPVASVAPPLEAPDLDMAVEVDRARAYRLSLAPGAATPELEPSAPCLLVAITDGLVELATSTGRHVLGWTSGTVVWAPSATTLKLANAGREPMLLAIIQLR